MGAISDTLQAEVALVDSVETQAVRIASEGMKRLERKHISLLECPQCGVTQQSKYGVRIIKCNNCGYLAGKSEAENARHAEMERRRINRLNRQKNK